MHAKISIAVPSRHRPQCLEAFLKSIVSTSQSKTPVVTVLHDSPESYDNSMKLCDENASLHLRSVWLPDKSGLAELWNWCIMTAPTEWVLICNDDITFNHNWIEYLEDMIASQKYLMIHLFHYGAMCLSKQFVLEHGWFDERFTGGGFEDVDSQLRISEAGLKDYIDRSHDFIKRDGDIEVGHFVNHLKYSYKAKPWDGKNNGPWIQTKWGRLDDTSWSMPSFRKFPEIDWHPSYTRKYMERYGYQSVPWLVKTAQSWQEQRPIFP